MRILPTHTSPPTKIIHIVTLAASTFSHTQV